MICKEERKVPFITSELALIRLIESSKTFQKEIDSQISVYGWKPTIKIVKYLECRVKKELEFIKKDYVANIDNEVLAQMKQDLSEARSKCLKYHYCI